MPDSDRDWRKWGSTDPYFGVLAHPHFRRNRIGEHRAEFFRTGEAYVQSLVRDLDASGARLKHGRALDHGCGTGRLTIPLGALFDRVVAADVAPAMLAEAKANAEAAGRTNIEFVAADDDLSHVDGQFDLVVSHLVLQHIPARRGYGIFAQLIERVRPGGSFHISVSIRNDRGALRALYWASANLPLVKGIQNRLRGDRWGTPAMQMNDYALGRLTAMLSRRGVRQLSLALDDPHPRFQTVVLKGTIPN